MLIFIIILLSMALVITYMGYRLYDSKKVPRDTPSLADDIKNKVTKTTKKKQRK